MWNYMTKQSPVSIFSFILRLLRALIHNMIIYVELYDKAEPYLNFLIYFTIITCINS